MYSPLIITYSRGIHAKSENEGSKYSAIQEAFSFLIVTEEATKGAHCKNQMTHSANAKSDFETTTERS
jgi:hypothetical protein